MKKIVSLILMILMLCQFNNLLSYASCNMEYVDEDRLDFKYTLKGMSSFKQTVDDKEVTITRFEDFLEQNNVLEQNIINAIKKSIQKENMKIDEDLLIYLVRSAYDFAKNTTTATDKALNNTSTKASSKDLDKLSDDEKKLAVYEGKKDAMKKGSAAVVISSAAGTSVWAAAKTLAAKGVGQISTVAGKVTAGPIIAITSSALIIGGFIYNHFYILPLSQEAQNAIDVHKNIYMQVRNKVVNHRWIGKNVLITAVPKDGSCMSGYASFHNINGVKYNKSQKSIDFEFAQSECKFLGQDHQDCINAALKTISCLRQNEDDPSQCNRNPYYYDGMYSTPYDENFNEIHTNNKYPTLEG